MFIEMTCACGSHFSVDGDDNDKDQLWHLTHRFTAAHQECGFLNPPSVDYEAKQPMKKRIIKPFIEDDDE